ncbi:MAG TPA: hypothetical protein IAB44_06275 [Candidatus Limivivens intestinipullorum]|uniref:Uncharacterized protein n=1 Tax=Candidatus Limivivens intestinipullorum TaxID=2840858 RepID=A0A9D1ERV5_9FIRM|nr:hypothetical protein [Candidatus Limivivens intestinipullorum]
MKKYNLSKIMKRAWELVKSAGMTISSGLKKAWEEAKRIMEKIKFERTAKVAKIVNGKQSMYVGTEYDSDSNYFTFNLWERGNMRRIYINDYRRRSVGYIDINNNNALVTEYSKGEVIETANWFIGNYEF